MTLDEQIEKVITEMRRMRSLTETRWGGDMLTVSLALVEIVKEQQKEIKSLQKKVNKADQGQRVLRSKDIEV